MFGVQSVLLSPHQIPLTPQIVIEIPDDSPPESYFPSQTGLDSPRSQQNLMVRNNQNQLRGACSPILSIPTPHCNNSCAFVPSSQHSLRDFQTLNNDYLKDIRSLNRSGYQSSQSNYFTSEHIRESSPLIERRLSNHIPIDLIAPDRSHLFRTAYSNRQSSCHCLNHNQTHCLIAKAASTHKVTNHNPQDYVSDFAYCHTTQNTNRFLLNPHAQHQSSGSQYSILEPQNFQFPESVYCSNLTAGIVKPKKYRRLSSPNGSSRASSGVFHGYQESRPTRLTQTWKLRTINDKNREGKISEFRSLPDLTKFPTSNMKFGSRSSNPYGSRRQISLFCQHSYRGDCLRRIIQRSPSDLRYCYPSIEQDCNTVCSEMCNNQTFGTIGRRRHTDGCSIEPKSLLVINSYRRTRSVSSRPMHRSFDPIFQNQMNLHKGASSFVGDLSESKLSHSDYKLSTNNLRYLKNELELPSSSSRIVSLDTNLNVSKLKNVNDKLVQKSTTSFRLCSCPLIVLLVCMQLVLGCTATALSLFLLWILPTLEIQECAYWATVPLLLTGLLGTYFYPGLRLPPLLLHHGDIIKWTSGFSSLICSILCLITCIFSGIRGNLIASLDKCLPYIGNSINGVNNTTNLPYPTSLSLFNTPAQQFRQPCCRDDEEPSCKCFDIYGISTSNFKQLSCRYLFSSIKDYLILQSALTGIGAAVCLWFCFILIEDRFKLIMLRSQQRISFSSARSSLPGSTSV